MALALTRAGVEWGAKLVSVGALAGLGSVVMAVSYTHLFGGMNSVLSGITCDKYSCADPIPMCNLMPMGGFDWRDAVLYFVFVDRFLDGNAANNAPSTAGGLDSSANWQGGDWAGLKQKIDSDYFGQLGVNALWITVPMDNTDAIGIGDDGRNLSLIHI